MSKKIKLLFLLSLSLINNELIYSQINDSLSILCDNINELQEITYPNDYKKYERVIYKFSILNNTLEIKFFKADSSIYQNKWVTLNDKIYRISLDDIKSIHLSDNYLANKLESAHKKHLEINALRNYQLFKSIDLENNGRSTRTELIEIPIIDNKDTLEFEKIISLISNYSNLKNNKIDASCKYDNLRFYFTNTDNLYAIESESLQEKVKLNGNKSINEEIYKLLIDYLVKHNIWKFYGSIVIDEKDKIIFSSNDQNEMYNQYLKLDSLTVFQEIMKENGHYYISDKMIDDMYLVLNQAQWEAGKCYSLKVRSYFNFFIENKNYNNTKR